MFDWPTASVLISAILPASIMLWKKVPPRRAPTSGASAADLAEIKTRLTGLESNFTVHRQEVRSDLKDIQQLIERLR